MCLQNAPLYVQRDLTLKSTYFGGDHLPYMRAIHNINYVIMFWLPRLSAINSIVRPLLAIFTHSPVMKAMGLLFVYSYFYCKYDYNWAVVLIEITLQWKLEVLEQTYMVWTTVYYARLTKGSARTLKNCIVCAMVSSLTIVHGFLIV